MVKEEHYPYIIVGALVLGIILYALIPKAPPVNTIAFSNIQVVNYTDTGAFVAVSLNWNAQVQPTYIMVDIQPKALPEGIPPESETWQNENFLAKYRNKTIDGEKLKELYDSNPREFLDNLRDIYHLIRQPQRWKNVRTTYDKTGSTDYYASIERRNSTEFLAVIKIANEETDLASAQQAFNLEQKPSISGAGNLPPIAMQ